MPGQSAVGGLDIADVFQCRGGRAGDELRVGVHRIGETNVGDSFVLDQVRLQVRPGLTCVLRDPDLTPGAALTSLTFT